MSNPSDRSARPSGLGQVAEGATERLGLGWRSAGNLGKSDRSNLNVHKRISEVNSTEKIGYLGKGAA